MDNLPEILSVGQSWLLGSVLNCTSLGLICFATMSTGTYLFLLPIILALSLNLAASLEPKDVIGKHVVLNTTKSASQSPNRGRDGRFFSVFQVVTFPNDVCTSTGTNNGTCYTSSECISRGKCGSGSGTCADGFGVCCIFSLSCGDTSSDNNTYLVMGSTTTQPSVNPCTYKICKSGDNICRIKLDFNKFIIANPQVGTTTTGNPAVPGTAGGAIGDCVADQFSVATPGGSSTPVICGTNTGQHIFVDASPSCNIVTINIGDSTTTREWDIAVTQYTCRDAQGGPAGCLQYFTGISGTISSFNFPTTATTVGADVTHLSNQEYQICIRTEKEYCGICYTTAITTAAIDISFGLSISPAATMSNSAVGASCIADYIQIPSAQAVPVAVNTHATSPGNNKFCGRLFHITDAQDAATPANIGTSVCSQARPFVVNVVTDADEVTAAVAMSAAAAASTNEMDNFPGGIVGFSLNYIQVAC